MMMLMMYLGVADKTYILRNIRSASVENYIWEQFASVIFCLFVVFDSRFVYQKLHLLMCNLLVGFQKEIRQWLERVSAEQDIPVLWDEEKTPSMCLPFHLSLQ